MFTYLAVISSHQRRRLPTLRPLQDLWVREMGENEVNESVSRSPMCGDMVCISSLKKPQRPFTANAGNEEMVPGNVLVSILMRCSSTPMVHRRARKMSSKFKREREIRKKEEFIPNVYNLLT